MLARFYCKAAEERDTLRVRLTELEALLQRCLLAVGEQHYDDCEAEFDLPANVMAEIDAALSTSAEPASASDGFSAE